HRDRVPSSRRPADFAARTPWPAATAVHDGRRRGRRSLLQADTAGGVERMTRRRLAIEHRTTYRYAGGGTASYNEGRLTPHTTPTQTTLGSHVDVAPAVRLWRYRDYWGSVVHGFDLHVPHTELEIVGTAVVDTFEATGDRPNVAGWNVVEASDELEIHCEY